jgi:hypothetical protein
VPNKPLQGVFQALLGGKAQAVGGMGTPFTWTGNETAQITEAGYLWCLPLSGLACVFLRVITTLVAVFAVMSLFIEQFRPCSYCHFCWSFHFLVPDSHNGYYGCCFFVPIPTCQRQQPTNGAFSNAASSAKDRDNDIVMSMKEDEQG